MPTGPASDPIRSLAATRTGEAVLIQRILFGALRSLCTDLGVRERDVVRCRAGTPSHLLLETPSGRTVPFERDWARFIQVSAAALSESRSFEPETDRAAV